jgi:hypothetical protein
MTKKWGHKRFNLPGGTGSLTVTYGTYLLSLQTGRLLLHVFVCVCVCRVSVCACACACACACVRQAGARSPRACTDAR